MNNSKEFQLPNGDRAFAQVTADPATGGALLAYNPLEVSAGRVNGLSSFAMRGSRLALAADTEVVVQEIATTLIASAAGVVKDSTGVYHFDLNLTAPGTWMFRWLTTGQNQAAEEGGIFVKQSIF